MILALSKNLKTASGLGLAVIFVLTITTPVNWLIYHFLLAPGALEWAGLPTVNLSFLKLVLFIAVIAAMVQALEMVIDRYSGPFLAENNKNVECRMWNVG